MECGKEKFSATSAMTAATGFLDHALPEISLKNPFFSLIDML
jgi:hypothetical protein